PRLQYPPAVYRGHCGDRAPARPVPRPSDRIAPRRRSDPGLRAPTLRARRCPLALHGLPSRQVTRLLIAGSRHARSAAPYAVGAEALGSALVFVVVCLSVWRQASPHWLTTCLCLATAAALFADDWSVRFRAAVSGVLTGVALCVHQHHGVFLAVWLALALAGFAYLSPRGE